MSVLDRLQSILPVGDSSGADTTAYECAECGNTFESMKPPAKATCMECLSDDVAAVDDA